MERIENNLGKLKKTESNFKKAPSRVYKKAFLEAKLQEVHKLRSEITEVH